MHLWKGTKCSRKYQSLQCSINRIVNRCCIRFNSSIRLRFTPNHSISQVKIKSFHSTRHDFNITKDDRLSTYLMHLSLHIQLLLSFLSQFIIRQIRHVGCIVHCSLCTAKLSAVQTVAANAWNGACVRHDGFRSHDFVSILMFWFVVEY